MIQNFFLPNYNMDVKKAKVYADFESAAKVAKIHAKKAVNEKVRE
jgi:hypothetical protein